MARWLFSSNAKEYKKNMKMLTLLLLIPILGVIIFLFITEENIGKDILNRIPSKLSSFEFGEVNIKVRVIAFLLCLLIICSLIFFLKEKLENMVNNLNKVCLKNVVINDVNLNNNKISVLIPLNVNVSFNTIV